MILLPMTGFAQDGLCGVRRAPHLLLLIRILGRSQSRGPVPWAASMLVYVTLQVSHGEAEVLAPGLARHRG